MCSYIIQPASPSNENDTYTYDLSDRPGAYLYFWSITKPEAAASGSNTTNSTSDNSTSSNTTANTTTGTRRRLEVANVKDLSTLYSDYNIEDYKLQEIANTNLNLQEWSFKGN